MKTASEWFTDADRATVTGAVAEAEKKTSGEIVPVVATASENYERAEGLGGIAAALAAVAIAWRGFQDVTPVQGDWTSGWDIRLGLAWILAIFAAGYVLGSLGVRAVPALKRMLVGRGRMQAEVTRSAAAAFERCHARGTKSATGVVIYVSLFEHMVAVLGDRAISEKVTDADWQQVCDTVVRGMRAGRPAEGLAEGIAQCGDLLARHFPVAKGDVNELTNELRLID